MINLKKLYAWLRNRCPSCQTLLETGYCYPCNNFPYRTWLYEEECLFLEDQEFQRNHPEEYAQMQATQNKHHVRRQLARKDGQAPDREMLVTVYGEALVAAVEQEIKLESQVNNSTAKAGGL